MAYVNRSGRSPRRRNHHPDILVHGWNKVRLTLHPLRGPITDAATAWRRIDGLA
jgi:4a-hydroxytetrahydrobiopterin dehydratase